MNILAIDTSTEACSAALQCADGTVFSEFEVAPRQHTRLLPIMMDAVVKAAGLKRTDLDYCAFGNGPGAFTGVRIAASTAQGIAIGLRIPLIPISTLAILAQAAFDSQPANSALVALDARMGEVYWAVYRRNQNGLAQILEDEKLSRIEDVKPKALPASGSGHGWLVGQKSWQNWLGQAGLPIDPDLLPDSRALLKLSNQAILLDESCKAEGISINYLRNQVAEKSKKT